MNTLYQKYRLNQLSHNDFSKQLKINQFEQLIETPTPKIYSNTTTTRGGRTQIKINCLDIDTYDNSKFLLSGHDDGSVALWSLDDKIDSSTHELINKKIQVSKRLIPSDQEAPPPAPPVQQPRYLYSTQTRTNKFRLYRGSSFYTDTPSAKRLKRSHQYGITTLKWYGPDNGMFFTGGNDNMIKIWDTNQFTTVESLNFNYKINQIDCLQDTSYIIVACEDYYPRLIDLKTLNMGVTVFGKRTGRTPEMMDPKSEILSCKINPRDSNIIASSDIDGRIKIWDIRKGNQLLHELIKCDTKQGGHSRACNDLIWNTNGKKLISIGLDGKIIQWDPFDNNIYENKFNDNENMNYFLVGDGTEDRVILKNNYKLIGDIDMMRNRYKKRISKRLEWFEDKYLLVVTDYGEIQIFDTDQGKYWNKIEMPPSIGCNNNNHTNSNRDAHFTGMALQQDMTNSKGLRVLTGTSTTRTVDDVQVMGDCPLVEYSL